MGLKDALKQGMEDKKKQQQAQAEQKAREDAERAFWSSPQGLARSAKESGQKFFQISLDISQTERSFGSKLSGAVETTTKSNGNQPHVLEMVENEGWRLENVGYIFQETGSVSRDKFLSSGQVEQVTGRTVGIYLFRAV